MPPRKTTPRLWDELPGLAALARDQGGALTRRQALAGGLPAAEYDRRVRNGDWYAPWSGVVVPDGPDPIRVAAAAVLAGPPGALAAAQTTLRLFDVQLSELPRSEAILVPPNTGPHRRAGLDVLQARLADGDRTRWFDVPTTTPARAVMDLARRRPRDILRWLIVADAVLHRERATHADLFVAAERLAYTRGVTAARRVAELARVGAESPGETRMRWWITVVGGLPEPELQFPVRQNGILVAEADMAYPERGLLLEYDGLKEHGDPDRMPRDRRRDRRLEGLGFTVLRFTCEDLHAGPTGVVDEVRRRLR